MEYFIGLEITFAKYEAVSKSSSLLTWKIIENDTLIRTIQQIQQNINQIT